MKRNLIYIFLLLVLPLMAMAQTINVNLRTADTDTTGVRLYFGAIDAVDDDHMDAMARLADGSFQQTVPSSQLGFYNLIFATATSQLVTPIYLEGKWDELRCEVRFVDGCPKVTVLPADKSKEAKAISARANAWQEAIYIYNKVYYVKSREIWDNAPTMTVDGVKGYIKMYADAAMHSVADESLPHDLRRYITTWAYLQSNDVISLYNRINKEKINSRQMLATEACKVLDNSISLLHSATLHTATHDVPRGTLSERLQYVCDNYKNAELRSGIHHQLINGFIRTYQFANGYQQGLDTLVAVRDRFGLGDEFVEKFRERISAVPGSLFPDVELIDAEGNKVTMDKYRGKYVYIDLWASWCVPCIKEIPFLHEIEKAMEGKDIVFVSISIDSSEKPWRKKMEELKLQGIQLLNADGKLSDKLNISGIPHFLIYDREGHLHTYNAPRPSSGEELLEILRKLN